MALPGLLAWRNALSDADRVDVDNIDYDDIKQYIKEQTTPGKGKTVAVPGRTDEKLQQFEDSLFKILKDQHYRIDLFVGSKAGEIQRRLDHSKRQLHALSAPSTTASDQRIPVGRLERYGKLENDILKAGDEIRSLARFTSMQRTAFRKLLKKYKKWTGSTQLEDRFRAEVLDGPKSFTKLDLGPLLDDLSTTLQQIRTLYDARMRQRTSNKAQDLPRPASDFSAVPALQYALDSGSKAEFDAAIATVPLGYRGTFTSYFVHAENVVELQVLILQHSRYFTSRSRSSSVATPVSSTPQSDTFGQGDAENADYFALEADDAERFAQEQNALMITDREYRVGTTPQKAKLCVRWNHDEEAHIAHQRLSTVYLHAVVSRKFVHALLDKNAVFPVKKAAVSTDSERSLTAVRSELEQNRGLHPLYLYSSCRSRFVGINNSNQGLLAATLDTYVTNQVVEGTVVRDNKSTFSFAVLLVRQEGTGAGGLLAALDQSHLVERVRGFSMEYHAIWETAKSANIPPPFWLPILDRDIRKLPPPALKRHPSSANRTPTSSTGSINGAKDSTTAVETARNDSATQELEASPIRSFRKKRRRTHVQDSTHQQQSYWSEYDHPEDEEANEAYVIYVDPNQKSAIDVLLDRLSGLFVRGRKPDDEEGLLAEPTTPKDSESSDDDEDSATVKPRARSYGTLARSHRTVSSSHRTANTDALTPSQRPFLPHMTAVSCIASLITLFVAYILASTGRHKLRYQVDFGVVFAVCSSLFFAIAGFATLLRQHDVSYLAWGVGILVLVIDAVGSGGLLAWMLG